MDLAELLDDNGLQQDEWSLTAPTFGKERQLTVVGWSGNRVNRSDKFYIIKCSVCSQDFNLFGQGYFRSMKSSLNSGRIPCGCSTSPKWSEEQYRVLCSRKAKEIGYTFIAFVGDWLAKYTKIKMLCEKHGEWESGAIGNLLNQGYGCPMCGFDVSITAACRSNLKTDEVMIQSFFKSGCFHSDTKFWKSDRETKRGNKSYWYMLCPECGEVGESQSGNLQRGNRPCACGMHRQREAYINDIIDCTESVIAIKFGITINSNQRVRQQNSKSLYKIEQHSVYYFPSVESCKKAERDCKRELECGILTKLEVSDGWSETTYTYNLEKIIEIYQRNGGIKIERKPDTIFA